MNNSPVVLVDPTEPRFALVASRLDGPDYGCALHASGNGGRAWIPATVPDLPEGAEKCYAPEIAFDRAGTLYYLFVGLAGNGNRPMGAFLATSTDRAQSFTAPRRVLGPLNFAVRMAVDPGAGRLGRIHLVWLHAERDVAFGGFGTPPNPILSAYSDDGGATFSAPVQVSDADRGRVVAPALALGPDNAVHVAYYDLGKDARDYQGLEGPVWEGTWSVVLTTSRDGGRRFGRGVVVDAGIVPLSRVMLIFTMPPPALVAGDSMVCAAWTDARHGDDDVVLRCSQDHGRSWGPLRRVNDDRIGNGLRQHLPRLALSPNGRLDAVFLDRRRDPANRGYDAYFTFSTDGGRRFAANRRISEHRSNSGIGQRYAGVAAVGQVELGGRLGLFSTATGAVAAWPDSSLLAGQDVRATWIAIESPSRRSPVGLPVAVGAGLVVVLAAVLVTGRRRRSRADH